jgi:tetratricopeptide (TPR) repeat protein
LMSVVDPASLTVAVLFAKALEELASEAGRSTWSGLGRLVELVRGRLRRDRAGQAALARVEGSPTDQAAVQALAEVVQQSAMDDSSFQRALLQVVAQAKQDPVIGRLVTQVAGHARIGTLTTIETVLGGLHLYPPAVSPASSASMQVPPIQLPPDVTDFTGREAELAALREQLAKAAGSHGGTVVISAIDGKPGIGKSALAIHLAHELAADFPDGQLYMNLRGAEARPLTPLQVLDQFLRALGVPADEPPTDLDAAVARYRTLLAGRRMLVLLDNAADAGQVRPLLPASPACMVLVTSRSQLATLEGASPFTLELLSENDAIDLLSKLAGHARVGADQDMAALIVHRCGLLPLAVRIVGARLRARPGWTLAHLASRLADERRRLTELEVGDLAVRASFTLSYQGLASGAARMFRLLGLLEAHDITGEMAAALARTSPEVAEETLERLVDAQLLESPAVGRYRFHDLLRLFARERGQAEEAAEERYAAVGRALGWYLTTTKQATELLQPTRLRDGGDRKGSAVFRTRRAALAWLEVERPNLVAAVRQATNQEQPTLAWELAETLHRYFDLRKHWADWQAINELALQAAKLARSRDSEAHSLTRLGLVFHQLRRFDQAVICARRSLAICREIGDKYGASQDLNILGRAYRELRRFDEAVTCLEESLGISREIGDRYGEGQTLSALGGTYWDLGRFDEAVTCLEEALAISREIGDRHSEGRILTRLGSVYRELRHLDRAATCLEDALTICREIGDGHGEGWTRYHLGRVFRELGRFDQAIACSEQSLTVFRQLRYRFGEGYALRGLGSALRGAQDEEAARIAWEEALAIFTELGASEANQVQRLLQSSDETEGPDRL